MAFENDTYINMHCDLRTALHNHHTNKEPLQPLKKHHITQRNLACPERKQRLNAVDQNALEAVGQCQV